MKFSPLLVLPFLAVGCSTLRVTPASPSLTWNRGTAYAMTHAKGLDVQVGTAESRPSPLLLMAVVSNSGTEPVTVAPAHFQVRGTAVQRCAAAEDPELHLQAIRGRLEALEPSQLVGTLNSVAQVSELAGMIAGETEEQRKQRLERESERREQEEDRRAEIAKLQREEARWERESLRVTTLQPGQSVTGFVQFECQVRAGEFEVRFQTSEPAVPFRIVKS